MFDCAHPTIEQELDFIDLATGVVENDLESMTQEALDILSRISLRDAQN